MGLNENQKRFIELLEGTADHAPDLADLVDAKKLAEAWGKHENLYYIKPSIFLRIKRWIIKKCKAPSVEP